MKQPTQAFSLSIAQERDREIVKTMCRSFHSASPYYKLPLDEDKLDTLVTYFLSNPREGIIILLNQGSVVCGLLCARVSDLLFNQSKVASEVVFWIEPEHRGGTGASLLIAGFEHWADEVAKVNVKQLVCLEDETVDKVSLFYKRKKYTPFERGFLKFNGRS